MSPVRCFPEAESLFTLSSNPAARSATTGPMSPEEQQRYRPVVAQRLETLEAEIRALADETQAIEPDASIGRLSRLDRGTYGRCQLCGQDIAAERLEYQPDAVTCVPCLSRRK